MTFNIKDNKNLLLNTLSIDGSGAFSVLERNPGFSNNEEGIKFLSFYDDINWTSIQSSDKITIKTLPSGDIIVDVSLGDPFENTEMFFSDGQVGIGRLPLHTYKVDIGVPVNTRMTGFHIGDGTYGLSMGNATGNGFLPQIIGMGSDSDDAGLYLLGKVSVDEFSNIPAIIFDGRAINNQPLTNRPILGITNGSYTEYKLIIDQNGNVGVGTLPGIYKMKVDGVLRAKNIIVDSSTEILDLKSEIEDLKRRLDLLEQK